MYVEPTCQPAYLPACSLAGLPARPPARPPARLPASTSTDTTLIAKPDPDPVRDCSEQAHPEDLLGEAPSGPWKSNRVHLPI